MTLLEFVPTWLAGNGFTRSLAGAIRVTVVTGLVTIVNWYSLSNAPNAACAVIFVHRAVTEGVGTSLPGPKSGPGT